MDYPNMSYCMCENTLSALSQVMEAMDQDGNLAFLQDLSSYERRAFEELARLCEDFAARAERVLDQELDHLEALRG